jgi:hypothetical protein
LGGNGKAPTGATEKIVAGNFLSPLRGLTPLTIDPTADAVGYFLMLLRSFSQL